MRASALASFLYAQVNIWYGRCRPIPCLAQIPADSCGARGPPAVSASRTCIAHPRFDCTRVPKPCERRGAARRASNSALFASARSVFSRPPRRPRHRHDPGSSYKTAFCFYKEGGVCRRPWILTRARHIEAGSVVAVQEWASMHRRSATQCKKTSLHRRPSPAEVTPRPRHELRDLLALGGLGPSCTLALRSARSVRPQAHLGWVTLQAGSREHC